MKRTMILFALVAGLCAPLGSGAATSRATPGSRAQRHDAAVQAHPAPAQAVPATRTLDDIHIEGEIPVPQVLFITARDQRRFIEFQHRRYLRTGAQLGQATEMPGWIVVTRTPIPAGKEIAR